MLFVQFKLALNQLNKNEGLFVLTIDAQGYDDMLKFLSKSERTYRHARFNQQSEVSLALQQTLSTFEHINIGSINIESLLVDGDVWMIEVFGS